MIDTLHPAAESEFSTALWCTDLGSTLVAANRAAADLGHCSEIVKMGP